MNLNSDKTYYFFKTSANDWPGEKHKFIMKIKARNSTLRIAMDTVESIHHIE